MKKNLILLFLIILPLSGSAALFISIDGWGYEITQWGDVKTVAVHHCPAASVDLVIPEKIVYEGVEYIVTSIYSYAFNKDRFSSVSIPNSVTSIGDHAFYGCSSLTSVNIPNSVTSIGNSAFEGCSGMTSVTIPNSVTSIGEFAFSGCSSLTSVNIPNSMTSIGNFVFHECSGMTSVVIPNSVTSIGDYAFYGCSGLTSVTIPNSVTSIGNCAFGECSRLASLSISENAHEIGMDAFEETAWFNNQPEGLVYAGKVAYLYKGEMPENTSISLKDGTLGIADDALSGQDNLVSVFIPNSVISIGDCAFQNSLALTSIDIPNSVISIGGNAFQGCSNLASVSGGNNLCHIGNGAFSLTSWEESLRYSELDSPFYLGKVLYWGGSSYESLIVKEGTVSISNSFWAPSGLKEISLPESLVEICDGAFYGTGIVSLTIPENVQKIGDNAFCNCENLTSVRILTKDVLDCWLVNLYGGCFKGCDNLKNIELHCKTIQRWFGNESIEHVVLSNTVTSIGAEAFCGFKNLKSIKIPESVSSIGRAAFSGSGLTSIVIPNGISSIGLGAFGGCSELKSVTIPNSVNLIAEQAFANCTSLTDFYCLADELPLTSYNNQFNYVPLENATLYVPIGCKEKYAAVEPWSKFKEIKEISTGGMGTSYDINNDGTLDDEDMSTLVNCILGFTDVTDNIYDTNNDGKIDVTDIVQLIGMMNDVKEGRLLDIDEENEGGYVDPTETEQQIKQLPSDEEGAAETVYDEEESLEYDALAQEVISMYDTDDDSDYYGNEVNKTRASDDELAQEAIRLNGKNIFWEQLTIEQQDWDTKRWGNTRYGGFKTFYNTQVKNGRRYLLVVFYYKGGFPNKKTASLRLGQLNSGKVLCKSTIYSNQEYAVLRVCIDDYLQNYGCFNIFPMLITDGSNARSYLNPFLVKSNDIVDSDWRNKYYGNEFGKINGVSVYCNTSTQGWNIGGEKYQCVELCKRYLTDLYEDLNRKYEERNWGHAIEWPYKRKNDTKDPGKYLVFANDGRERVREGDLIVWQHGTYGHIGVVISVKPNKISVAHQNGDIGKYASPIGTSMKLENGVIKDIVPGTNRSPIFKSIQYVPYFIRINSDGEHYVPYNASMSASTTNIKYNPTQLGKSLTKTFIIYNSKGMGTLNISSIAAKRGNGFSVDVTKCSIKPGDFQPVNVTFTPSESGEYKDIIMIESDADDNPTWTVHLSGTGIGN